MYRPRCVVWRLPRPLRCVSYVFTPTWSRFGWIRYDCRRANRGLTRRERARGRRRGFCLLSLSRLLGIRVVSARYNGDSFARAVSQSDCPFVFFFYDWLIGVMGWLARGLSSRRRVAISLLTTISSWMRRHRAWREPRCQRRRRERRARR